MIKPQVLEVTLLISFFNICNSFKLYISRDGQILCRKRAETSSSSGSILVSLALCSKSAQLMDRKNYWFSR